MTRRKQIWWRPWPLVPAKIILDTPVAFKLAAEAWLSCMETLERAAILVGIGGRSCFRVTNIISHDFLDTSGVIVERGMLKIKNDSAPVNAIRWDESKLLLLVTQGMVRDNEQIIFVHTHPVTFLVEIYPSPQDILNSLVGKRAELVCGYIQKHSQRRGFLAIGYLGTRTIPVFVNGRLLLEDMWTYLKQNAKT